MIIGLHGKARSGKDTAASYLESKLELETLSFAGPMKEASMALFGLSKEEAYGLNGYDREKDHPFWGFSVRRAQQTLGTECMRHNFGNDFWIAVMEQRLKNLDGAVISDVRFQNEADWVKSKGGVLVEIVRSRHKQELQGDAAKHISEAGVAGADVVICNNGSLQELYEKLFNQVVKHERIQRTS